VAVGFHPKHAKSSSARIEEEAEWFFIMIKSTTVKAFDAVGLDHTGPMKY
jgi:hypothetical protein